MMQVKKVTFKNQWFIFSITGLMLVLSIFVLLFIQTKSNERLNSIKAKIEIIKNSIIISLSEHPEVLSDDVKISKGIMTSTIKKNKILEIQNLYDDEDVKKIIMIYATVEDFPKITYDTNPNAEPFEQLLLLEKLINKAIEEQSNIPNLLQLSLILFLIAFLQYVVIREFKVKNKIHNLNTDQELNKRIIEILEAEHAQIAYDLHDSVLQNLAFIKMQTDSSPLPETTDLIRKITDNTILELRTMYLSLHGEKQQRKSLCERLDTLFDNFKMLSSIDLEASQFALSHLQMSSDTADQIYKIAHELLANGYKHCNGTKISLNIFGLGNMIRIIYSDNGKIDHSQFKVSDSIIYRAKIINAKIELPEKDNLLKIKIEVPI